MCRSALEGGRDIRVRRVDGERKVARPLLLVVNDAGKSAVELPSCDGVDVLVRRGGEQRVREAENVAVDFEDVRLGGGLQRIRLVPGVPEKVRVGCESAAATASASFVDAGSTTSRSRTSSRRFCGTGSGSPGAGVAPLRWSARPSSSA